MWQWRRQFLHAEQFQHDEPAGCLEHDRYHDRVHLGHGP
jgi:hypothetical protein